MDSPSSVTDSLASVTGTLSSLAGSLGLWENVSPRTEFFVDNRSALVTPEDPCDALSGQASAAPTAGSPFNSGPAVARTGAAFSVRTHPSMST